MRKCEDCRLILESDVRHCPKCGRSVADEPPTGGSSDVEVGALLTSANLHRIRHEWDEAISDLSDAMRRDPRNRDIASLLGGVYEQRGMLDDALIWYQMSVEMNPGNVSDAASLERVKKRLASQSPDKRQMLHKQLAALAAAMLLVVVVLLVVLLARRQSPPRPVNQPTTEARSRSGYESTRKPPTTGSKRDVGARESSAEPTKAALPPPSARTPGESAVRTSLAGSTLLQESDVAIDDVVADPRDGVVVVTFTVPAKVQMVRNELIRAAWTIARATFDASTEAKFVTARCLITPGGAGSTQIGFVGDIGRSTLEAQGPNPSDEQIGQSFTRQWWNPQITR